MSTHDDAILREHELAESRALLEAAPTPATKHLGFFQTLNRMRELARCTTCGKSTLTLNASQGTRGFKAERVTLETHCACPGGPAHHLIAAGSGGQDK